MVTFEHLEKTETISADGDESETDCGGALNPQRASGMAMAMTCNCVHECVCVCVCVSMCVCVFVVLKLDR